MKLQENSLQELAISLNPGGDDPKTGDGGDQGEGGDDPKKQ